MTPNLQGSSIPDEAQASHGAQSGQSVEDRTAGLSRPSQRESTETPLSLQMKKPRNPRRNLAHGFASGGSVRFTALRPRGFPAFCCYGVCCMLCTAYSTDQRFACVCLRESRAEWTFPRTDGPEREIVRR